MEIRKLTALEMDILAQAIFDNLPEINKDQNTGKPLVTPFVCILLNDEGHDGHIQTVSNLEECQIRELIKAFSFDIDNTKTNDLGTYDPTNW